MPPSPRLPLLATDSLTLSLFPTLGISVLFRVGGKVSLPWDALLVGREIKLRRYSSLCFLESLGCYRYTHCPTLYIDTVGCPDYNLTDLWICSGIYSGN